MRQRIKKYKTKWNLVYNGEIPDEAPTRLEDLGKAPSYRLICKTILKNDFQCETLGFNKTKSKTYSDLKRVELQSKGVITQLNLFL